MNGFDELLKQLFPQQKPVYQPTAANQLTAPKPQAEVTAYEPTLRQRGQQAVQGLLENIGYDRGYSRGVSQSLLGGPSSTLPMDMGLADIVPGLGYLLGAEDSIEGVKSAKKNLDEGNIGSAALEYGLSGLGLLPGIAGMHAYHGTPHDIKGGFDLSKIGTGEGAQAYGYGTYFSKDPNIASGYKTKLSNVEISVNGNPLSKFNVDPRVTTHSPFIFDKPLEYGLAEYTKALKTQILDYPELQKDIKFPKQLFDEKVEFLKSWGKGSKEESAGKALEQFAKENGYPQINMGGNLYKVDIPDEQIPRMLDWNKPIAQQNTEVLNILKNEPAILADLANGKSLDKLTGEQAYQAIASTFDVGQADAYKLASEYLNSKGIPGIRYLSPDSRGVGKGAENFVSFDPTTVKILEKNDMPVSDYKGSHTAPNANSYGATLDDLTKIMPKNVYTREGKNLYGLGDDVIDREWWMTAMKAKGKPDYEVEVFRAVPKGIKDINSGDWVTTSKKYAENHGESALSGDYDIISKKVKAKTLSTAGDPQEYGYNAD